MHNFVCCVPITLGLWFLFDFFSKWSKSQIDIATTSVLSVIDPNNQNSFLQIFPKSPVAQMSSWPQTQRYSWHGNHRNTPVVSTSLLTSWNSGKLVGFDIVFAGRGNCPLNYPRAQFFVLWGRITPPPPPKSNLSQAKVKIPCWTLNFSIEFSYLFVRRLQNWSISAAKTRKIQLNCQNFSFLGAPSGICSVLAPPTGSKSGSWIRLWYRKCSEYRDMLLSLRIPPLL